MNRDNLTYSMSGITSLQPLAMPGRSKDTGFFFSVPVPTPTPLPSASQVIENHFIGAVILNTRTNTSNESALVEI